ncbi:tyrosine-type recombinase/integrase [Actinacidiphila polyblastidii]|uniref:tyrosine-type recombinase/integrase n=1 Tax=Actinacidiphila polyblastidii TaxID=3110430 RepID=UPI0039BC35F4
MALGLRQGDVLGLQWGDADFEAGVIRVRGGRLRPRYAHGCAGTCGRAKAGFRPQKVNTRRETKSPKSKAGRRLVGLPEELVKLLRQHRAEQDHDRTVARVSGRRRNTPSRHRPANRSPRTRTTTAGRTCCGPPASATAALHDARHTAATVLLIPGVPDAVVDAIMGWEPGKSVRMWQRYQQVTRPVLQQTAAKVGHMP